MLWHLIVEITVVLLASDNLFFNILNKWYFIVYCLYSCSLFGLRGKSFMARILIYLLHVVDWLAVDAKCTNCCFYSVNIKTEDFCQHANLREKFSIRVPLLLCLHAVSIIKTMATELDRSVICGTFVHYLQLLVVI